MYIRNKIITFASVLALQAAAFCFATNSFACNRVRMEINTTGVSEEQANYIVRGSRNHRVIDPEKMSNRRARAKILQDFGVFGEYVLERHAGNDKHQTLIDMRGRHAGDNNILDILDVVQALSNNPPVALGDAPLDIVFNRVYTVGRAILFNGNDSLWYISKESGSKVSTPIAPVAA